MVEIYSVKVGFTCAYAISQALAVLIFRFFWKYIDSKPLGMQTVFDLTLKVTIQGFLVYSSFAWICFIKFKETYDPETALILVSIYYFNTIWVYLWTVIMVSTRYMIIFHSHILDNFEDSKFIMVSKIVVTTFSLLATFVEELKGGTVYLFFTNVGLIDDPSNNLKVFKVVVGFVTLVLVFVQAKIWILKVKTNHTHPTIENENNQESSKKKINKFLCVLALTSLTSTSIIYWAFARRNGSVGVYSQHLTSIIFSQIMYYNILPLTWIWMTPRMKTELKNEVFGFLRRFKSLFVANVVAPIESEVI